MLFLGLNSFSHHASAALVDRSGSIIAAVEEERFSRVKRDSAFPVNSIRYCLKAAGIPPKELAGVAFGWSPGRFALDRILRSHLLHYPVTASIAAGSVRWLANMMRVRSFIENEIGKLGKDCRVSYFPHHLSHAASAYYCSGFDEAAFLTLDGRGEIQSMTWGIGRGANLRPLGASRFPHSLGKLYSAICRYLGFTAAEKDGTVMALAAYGKPDLIHQFHQLVSWKPADQIGTLRLNTRYFDLMDVAGPSREMERLFGHPTRRAGDDISDFHRNVAASLQHLAQEIIVNAAVRLREITGSRRLVMAGGVALNTVANGLIADRAGFEDIFIQPASHDGGLSLGAACISAVRRLRARPEWLMRTAALGPQFTDAEILSAARAHRGVIVRQLDTPSAEAATRLAAGEIVGWFQGRLEFGPRALGQRCLLADPRDLGTRERLNRIKRREPFRPFAAAVAAEEAGLWLRRATRSPFMLLVDRVKSDKVAKIPAVIHVDGSVRVQTVDAQELPEFHALIRHFERLTGVPVIVSTSLNVRGEPLACIPDDAIRLLTGSDLDALIIGHFLLTRGPRPSM